MAFPANPMVTGFSLLGWTVTDDVDHGTVKRIAWWVPAPSTLIVPEEGDSLYPCGAPTVKE